jgi:AraC-like DNA-binding protein
VPRVPFEYQRRTIRAVSARKRSATLGTHSTENVDPHGQLAAWQELLSRVFFPMRIEGAHRSRFVGAVSSAALGDLQLSEVSAESEVVRRTARLAAVDDNDHYAIAVQRSGSYRISHDGRDTVVGPGDFTIYDCTRPWEMRFQAQHSTLVTLIPRAALPFSPRDMEPLTAAKISGDRGVGALVRPLLLQLADDPRQYQAVTSRVSVITLSLIGTLVGELLGPSPASREAEQNSLLWRIKAYIEANLGDPDLSPSSVATAHHISLRTLHNLFRDEQTTVGALIRHRRLERCHRELADPLLSNEPIQVIAARYGLINPAYFSRLFRSYYGMSPSDVRAHAVDGVGALEC